MYLHKFVLFFRSFVLLIILVRMWFNEIVCENSIGSHKRVMGSLFCTGMIVFILSEICFFFRFFWRFFYSRINPLFINIKVCTTWPPFHSIDAWRVPFIKTLLLVCSGITLTWGHHMILRFRGLNNIIARWVHLRFMLTVALGLCFEGFQFEEYLEKFFSVKSTVYGRKFYILTGFHGLHVLVGLIILFVSWARFTLGHFKNTEHKNFLLGAWYWHFVDVVWLFLFIFIYLLYNSAVQF